MNKTRKLLIGLGIIGIIGYFAIWYDSGGCDLYIGDDKCIDPDEMGYKPFRKEDWCYTTDYFHTNCLRELMICDLTQNIIPVGTPYEKVVALLGIESDQYPSGAWRVRDSDSYHSSNPKPLSERKLLAYSVGSSVSGPNALVIVFEYDRVEGFFRLIAI